MVIKAYKSLLGEDWFQSFYAFRLNPETFLDKRKLTRDAFCLDVLKELYLDYIEIQNKIHLLLLLQEYSSLLIKDANLLEQVVGSLINLCDILGTKPDKRLLKSQILVTIVTILLSQNLDHDFSRLVAKVKALLIDTIYNTSEDSTVISTGCQCLEELEAFYPGSLEYEIRNLLAASEQETSPAFQSYILLLSVCVKHITTKVHDGSSGLQKIVETKGKDIQVSSLVSHLLELLPYMTYTAMYRVLKDLIFVVKHTPDLSPAIFKLYLPNLMMSSDLPLFHLAFDLLEAFGSELVSIQEEKYLFMQIMKMSTHPCLTASHRLLFLDWLKSCALNKEIVYFSSLSHYSNLHIILPAPFDGPLTQEKKSCVLCLSIPSNTDESSAGEFLNECINGLIKCSLMAGGTKAAPSLFRTLFVYFHFHKSESMQNTMYKLLTGIMKTSPHLTPYALSFLQSVKNKCPESQFHKRILGHLVEHILSIPMKQFFGNLEYYLGILENASQEHASVCRPRAVLRLIQKLLSNTEFKFKNIWSTGNEILSVCRTILKYHDVQIFYYDLAEVLCLITQNFDDADVKDRAKIYYTMLTSLSKLKVQTIFNLHSSVKDAKDALNTFVAGGDSSQFTCIQKLSKPILKLIRMTNNPEIPTQEDNKADTFLSVCIPDVLETYQSYLTTHEPTLELPFILKHINSVENNFSNLYSIVINTHSEPASKDISVIEIPVLKNLKTSDSEGNMVILSLKPVEPYPLILHFKAEFTCDVGYNYTCHLPSVALKFEDLFMPLSVPKSVKFPAGLWRQTLFDDLWNNFKHQVDSRESQSNYCQSLYCVKMDKEFFSIVEQRWKPFIVYKIANATYNVAVCLPPENHILMKMSVVNDKPFVNIIVDNNKTLPWITVCLQDMSEIIKPKDS